MQPHPTTGDAVRQHSAVALFRAIRQVITYRKLARTQGVSASCTNAELYAQLNPAMGVYLVSHPQSMQAVLRDWCYNNRLNLNLLRMEEGIGMIVPSLLLNSRTIMEMGDNWELTEDAVMLITNLRTNEAIDEHVAFALRGLEQDL